MLFHRNTGGCRQLVLGLSVLLTVGHVACETCTTSSGSTKSCDNGCCGSSCCNDGMSTSVLIVACAVSGLVLLALVAAIVICCYKNYKDKQMNRVRNLRHEQRQAAPRVPAEPPKPPTYIEAPPAYSEELPDSHFRPVTVNGQYPVSNQRFSMGQLRHQNRPINNNTGVHMTQASRSVPAYEYRIPVTANRSTTREPQGTNDVSIPGSMELPPPYSEHAFGQTPAHVRASGNRANNVARDSPLPEETVSTTTASRALESVVSSESSNSSSANSRAAQTRNSNVRETQSRGRERSGRSRIPTRTQQRGAPNAGVASTILPTHSGNNNADQNFNSQTSRVEGSSAPGTSQRPVGQSTINNELEDIEMY